MATKHYTKENVTIKWDSDVCIHSAICAQGLKEVFNPRERPWINMEGADLDEIVSQVKKCPSGAISLVEEGETIVEEVTRIEVRPNGPLKVHGTILVEHNGQVETREKITSLCRCGASSKKPFCDGTHVKIEFQG